MLNRSIRDRKLPKIMPYHLRLNLNLLKLLPLINPHDTANHLRHHNHISQMRLDQIRLLIRLRILLSFAEFLDQTVLIACVRLDNLVASESGELN